MQATKFKLGTTAEKGGIATAILILSLYLESLALARLPPEVVAMLNEQFPSHTLAVSIGGTLGSLWNAGKYWAKRLARRKS